LKKREQAATLAGVVYCLLLFYGKWEGKMPKGLFVNENIQGDSGLPHVEDSKGSVQGVGSIALADPISVAARGSIVVEGMVVSAESSPLSAKKEARGFYFTAVRSPIVVRESMEKPPADISKIQSAIRGRSPWDI